MFLCMDYCAVVMLIGNYFTTTFNKGIATNTATSPALYELRTW
jgi:hypothetical protein